MKSLPVEATAPLSSSPPVSAPPEGEEETGIGEEGEEERGIGEEGEEERGVGEEGEEERGIGEEGEEEREEEKEGEEEEEEEEDEGDEEEASTVWERDDFYYLYWNARVQQLVAAVGSHVGQKTDEVSAFLAARGLPLAVDVQQRGISDGLWSKVQEVQAKGGLAAVQETVSSLEKMAAEANGCLEDLQRKLEERQDEYRRCGGRFPSQWTRLQSEQLNRNFFQSIKTYREQLKLAEDANKSVYAKVETGKKAKDLFRKSREELAAAAPTSSSSNAESPQKQAVRASVWSLEASVKTLHEKLDALRTQAAAYLMEAYQQQQPLGMAALDPLRVEISQASNAVSRGLTDLGGAWEALKKEDARTVWLGNLAKAATSLSEAQGEAAEGIAFFNKLLDNLRTLKQQTSTSTRKDNGRLQSSSGEGVRGASEGQGAEDRVSSLGSPQELIDSALFRRDRVTSGPPGSKRSERSSGVAGMLESDEAGETHKEKKKRKSNMDSENLKDAAESSSSSSSSK
uniref:ALIX V-shaped domain-containing protein n=1 Tax=Chromera velia CCMP2878 TaxID=1169474 RepID=A0A0G4HB19_9ALVE|eukprot:Cvel_6159.t1-p1 / transcript=Cvel_6159.t1 / gene=Cvel_6159 / organism=Chromera_velia_CCMP2878 / gene_product=Apoptosis-linked gene 2-interacting protein X 1, putative / transcript_product=Apoptosis-linked gene 2-interacting protein X 1, putative / location=Cvel_scaffold298:1336-6140(+) / protein_length=513 / sequence_SO=supercontig / SO=protein_coding / is_pseudo=false